MPSLNKGGETLLMADADTLSVEFSLRELLALQVLLSSGERLDEASLVTSAQKVDAAMEAFRHKIGTVRFGAVLKNAWRRDQ